MKVDVIINVYGKPFQTLCTLKSLMLHSGKHIDKIYFIQEKQQPYNEKLEVVINEFDNIVHFIPAEYSFLKYADSNLDNIGNRYCYRYQYGIENTNKKYVFITHNDILYKGDIIGEMLNEISDNVGIGVVGQCWNCPAYFAKKCDGDNYLNYKPDLQEITELLKQYPSPRTSLKMIDKNNIMPLPECRLNEFACLLDVEITNKECYPSGTSPMFGSSELMDIGGAYFRSMTLKGYKFKNYDINKKAKHCYFANLAGYQVQLDETLYNLAEQKAKRYYKKYYQKGVK